MRQSESFISRLAHDPRRIGNMISLSSMMSLFLFAIDSSAMEAEEPITGETPVPLFCKGI